MEKLEYEEFLNIKEIEYISSGVLYSSERQKSTGCFFDSIKYIKEIEKVFIKNTNLDKKNNLTSMRNLELFSINNSHVGASIILPEGIENITLLNTTLCEGGSILCAQNTGSFANCTNEAVKILIQEFSNQSMSEANVCLEIAEI